MATNSAWHFYAVDYGQKAAQQIERAVADGFYAHICYAHLYAVKAFHFAAKELDRVSNAQE